MNPTAAPTALPVWYSAAQVCAALQISRSKLWRMTRANQIEYRIWGGVTRYPGSVLAHPGPKVEGQGEQTGTQLTAPDGPSTGQAADSAASTAQPKALEDFPMRRQRRKKGEGKLRKLSEIPWAETRGKDLLKDIP